MTNYLYNGIELPALPEWDKTTYPYAYISQRVSDGAYVLVCTNSKVQYVAISKMAYSNCDFAQYVAADDSFALEKTAVSTNVYIQRQNNETLIWANVDVMQLSDNTVYLAASDPIPVSNPPAPAPFWMLMGWLIGRAIAKNMRAPGGVIPEKPDEEPIIGTWAELNGDALALYGSYQAAMNGDTLEVE